MAPKVLSEFLLGLLSPWRPEVKLTISGLVNEPAAHARMGITQTPAFLPAQGLLVVLKRIMVWIPFFLKQSFFLFFP